jgi:PAS domain S-box-containing protein
MERSALVGLPFARFADPEGADGWHLQFHSLIRTGERRSFRIVLRRSDGSALPTRVACEGRPGSDGKPLVRVVVTDISEQVEMETALRESQARLSAVLDEFHDGYWHWSAADGQTVYSGRLATMLGIAGEGQGGERPFDPSWVARLHGDDVATARMTTEDLLHGRRDRFDVEFRWHMPDGTGKWVRARGRVVRRDGHGKALRITGTLSDITENKHLRESLRRMEPPGDAGGGAALN